MDKSKFNTPCMLPKSISGKIYIVSSSYNDSFTIPMVKETKKTINLLASNLEIVITTVPGAFEIPIVVEAIAKKISPLCIIALGVVIRGETPHADLISESLTKSLQKIGNSYLIPVIHQVLLVNNESQALDRTKPEGILNRGKEAGEAAIHMINIMASIK